MRAIALTPGNGRSRFELLRSMYQLRHRVFHDRLDWNVATTEGLEVDIFDTLDPSYLLVLCDDGEVVGSVRILPTTSPTMIGDVFPELLEGRSVPHDAGILESSRFCVDTTRVTDVGRGGLNRATLTLFAAMIEHLRASEARSIVTVSDLRMERILRRAGWPLERIATPRRIGPTVALAGFLHDSDGALSALYRQIGIAGPVLQDLPGVAA